MNRKRLTAIIYFAISTIITWWFIDASPLYESLQQKIVSCSIAGTKWGLQLCAAFIFLKNNKWDFIKNISVTCLAGSTLLLPYAVLAWFFGIDNTDLFVGSLLVAVAVMILLYALSVRNAGLPLRWWVGWLTCLAVAILLQLSFVFHVL
ncbi:MAG: hypothetical protein EOO13_01225 [Chitinophagaceae bacterium]|nr:MAG: hypothetical protein EOO13_01225 [Chitinophagaceae bacterium]